MNDAQLVAELDEYMPSFAGEPADWPDVLRRVTRRPHHRRLLIAAVVAALLAVPAGLAFGSKLADLFEGTPATPAIQADYVRFNADLTEAIRSRFSAAAASGVHAVEISQIHGVMAIQTSEGEVDLWSAPEQGDAGNCFYVQYANPIAPDTAGSGGGGCDPATAPNSTNISAGNYWTRSHASLQIIYGYAYGGATSVELDLSDGSTFRLPVTERYFLAAVDAKTQITRISSYDAQGTQVGEATLAVGG